MIVSISLDHYFQESHALRIRQIATTGEYHVAGQARALQLQNYRPGASQKLNKLVEDLGMLKTNTFSGRRVQGGASDIYNQSTKIT
jgi:hypothetical protein